MALFVSGLSHPNAPVELREQLAVDEDKLRELLRGISSTNVVPEGIVLSTRNPGEGYAGADVPREARHGVWASSAAGGPAKKIFGGLEGKAALLVGAGKMGGLAARHLVERGVFPVYATTRTWARARERARALSGPAVPFDELSTALA